MKYLLTIAIVSILSAFTMPGDGGSIHSFKVKSIEGGTIDFSKFKGKKILVVNTASKCGYTPQYEALEKVYEQYKDKLVIVGFPANNFGAQEPGSDGEIQEFCKARFGVKFPLASKISVKG
jgi:glutathione peroxidase